MKIRSMYNAVQIPNLFENKLDYNIIRPYVKDLSTYQSDSEAIDGVKHGVEYLRFASYI